jgi:putative membrane protein
VSELLPHWNGLLNAVIAVLLVLALRAIRRGERERHRRLMLGATAVGLVFVASYVLQTWLEGGHRRFPGDDAVRTLFVVILASHTALSVLLVPLLATTLTFAFRGRFDRHRRLARITFPIWLYVAVTGVAIYVMNRYVRPIGPPASAAVALEPER